MNTETIKRIVDDERVERLTAQLCRHWDVATERLEELVQDKEWTPVRRQRSMPP